MSTEENKALVRRFYEEVFNQKNTTAIGELFDPNLVDHSLPPGLPEGIEGARQLFSMFQEAFPDLHFTVEDIIAEGDKVVARLTVQGTQQGALMGIPPTGKRVAITATDIVRIAGGKIVDIWANFDQLGMLQQLGVVPAP
jgi:steroid delta-isomerase-like uncharacterized protein